LVTGLVEINPQRIARANALEPWPQRRRVPVGLHLHSPFSIHQERIQNFVNRKSFFCQRRQKRSLVFAGLADRQALATDGPAPVRPARCQQMFVQDRQVRRLRYTRTGLPMSKPDPMSRQDVVVFVDQDGADSIEKPRDVPDGRTFQSASSASSNARRRARSDRSPFGQRPACARRCGETGTADSRTGSVLQKPADT
jgi:hypothetical protein